MKYDDDFGDPEFEDSIKAAANLGMIFMAIWFTIALGIVGGLIWVASHFISKYW